MPIASTPPELLPACVALFIHPDDPRYAPYLGQLVTMPLFGRAVPLLAARTIDLCSITRVTRIDIKNRLTGPPTAKTAGGIEILIRLH